MKTSNVLGISCAGIVTMCLMLPLVQSSGVEQGHSEGPNCSQANTTAEMRACAIARDRAATEALEVAYQKLDATLSVDQKRRLRDAQDAWLRFRDAEVAFEAAQAGEGSIAQLVKTATRTALTEARTAELRRLLRE